MSNAEQNTGQKQQEQGTSEWDSLSEPFDTSKIENPTQDDLSYEAWLKSNANPDFETDRDGNPNHRYYDGGFEVSDEYYRGRINV